MLLRIFPRVTRIYIYEKSYETPLLKKVSHLILARSGSRKVGNVYPTSTSSYFRDRRYQRSWTTSFHRSAPFQFPSKRFLFPLSARQPEDNRFKATVVTSSSDIPETELSIGAHALSSSRFLLQRTRVPSDTLASLRPLSDRASISFLPAITD